MSTIPQNVLRIPGVNLPSNRASLRTLICLGVYTAIFLLETLRLAGKHFSLVGEWSAAALPCAAFLVTFMAYIDTLPAGQVVGAAASIGIVSTLLQCVFAGPVSVAWATPLWANVAILNPLAVARTLLPPSSTLPNRGLFVIALASLLAAILAASANGVFFMLSGSSHASTLSVVLVIGSLVAPLASVVAAPWLINKKPGGSAPAPLVSLFLWNTLVLGAYHISAALAPGG